MLRAWPIIWHAYDRYERALSENRRLDAENAQQRQELAAFDPLFFEELEDLKYGFEQVCSCDTVCSHVIGNL